MMKRFIIFLSDVIIFGLKCTGEINRQNSFASPEGKKCLFNNYKLFNVPDAYLFKL